MNFRIFQPAQSLAPYVKQYYHLQHAGNGPVHLPQQLFSLGDLYLVFMQEGEVTFRPSQHTSFTLPAASVVGHFTCHHQVTVQGPVKMTVVQLNAYGFYKLAGLDMSAFSNYFRDVEKHPSCNWQQLVQDVFNNTDPAGLDALLDKALSAMIAENPHSLKQVDEVADYMQRHQGYVNMERLSKKFKISRPTLERKFMEVIGITPRLYARMLRFKDAMLQMQKMNLEQWQHFITNNDHYSHDLFVEDFRFFKGESPVLQQEETTITQMPVAMAVA
jgi:AraC-like DNA-binding protein